MGVFLLFLFLFVCFPVSIVDAFQLSLALFFRPVRQAVHCSGLRAKDNFFMVGANYKKKEWLVPHGRKWSFYYFGAVGQSTE